MLNYQFNGYEGFKEIFGMQAHGNGTKSRRNKILLALMTCRPFWQALRTAPFKRLDGSIIEEKARKHFLDEFYALKNMNDLRQACILFMSTFKCMRGEYPCTINMEKDDVVYSFRSSTYEIDNGGVCFDGDTRAIRYINHESGNRIYKMKAGKLLRKLIDENYGGQFLPEQVKVWLCEDFAERWQAYAKRKVSLDDLHVGNSREDFKRIYSYGNYAGDFGSCMAHGNGEHSSFYADAVDAKAAWLTNEEGMITARCIIFTNVVDVDSGEVFRLAERQYSSGGDNVLKRLLVDKLISAGEIDGYKQVGVDCHNASAYIANDGTSLSDRRFRIDCRLEPGDILSYQDSFKWFDESEQVAYNYEDSYASQCLDETDLHYRDEDDHEDDYWSEYHQEWLTEEEAYYVETRDDYFYGNEVQYANRWGRNGWYNESCFEDDVIEINGDYYYAGRNCENPEENGIYTCPNCGALFVPGREDSVYSELTGYDYCCDSCMEEGIEEYVKDNDCRYDAYEEEWYRREDCDWVRILVWDCTQHRRVNGYTQRNNLSSCSLMNYKGNWYYGYLSNGLPREIAQAMQQAA